MNNTLEAVYRTDFNLPDRREGKVRDIYRVPMEGRTDPVLIVASDRMSAFDVVMPTPFPGKGRLLTEISLAWFDRIRTAGIIQDHLLSTDPADVPGLDEDERASLEGRMMLCRAAEVVPIECVVRGYLSGSGWKDYQATGSVCGVELPEGLQNSSKLPEPIFTPATKATEGHDENIDFERACEIAGTEVMTRLRDLSLQIFEFGRAYAAERGMILADTKFEFGFALDADGNPTDELMLIDEVLTPDSSRYWPAEDYEPGREQDNFNKQIFRNWLQEMCDRGDWDKTPPGPSIPAEIVSQTIAKYHEAANRLGS
ncbi:MAG: phosphoribosylaminoimidazolesuccinocarboxamide synthase [Phycisphaerales bacterium]|nr:phosphoribosylaminoimidazolesuccinocarboxamide synthase [Phycisphaerales bacterium]